MVKNTNSVALYMRTAQKSEAGIFAQRTALEEWCEENGVTAFDEYVDNGYSGLNRTRPAFQKLCNAAKVGMVKTIVAADLSRLSRDWMETEKIICEFIRKFGVRLVAINDGLDSGDKHGGNRNGFAEFL